MHELVSVVITTYNRKQLLLETLNSVKSQSWKALEIVVVDDGSGERTFTDDEAKSLGIRYFYITNSGQSAARNYGVAQAQGKYVAFLDDDDLWLPHRIERQMAEIMRGAKWVACDCTYFHHDTKNDYDRHSLIIPPASGKVFLSLLRGCFIASPTVLVEKQLIVDCGGFIEDRRARYGEDWFMWLQIAAREPLMFINETMARYRIHGTSMLGNSNLNAIHLSHEIGLDYVFKRIPADLWRYKSMAHVWDLRRLARIAHGRKEYPLARSFAIQAWKLRPTSFLSLALLLAMFAPPSLLNRLRRKR